MDEYPTALMTYRDLHTKFLDKGYEVEFYYFVLPPAAYDPSRLIDPDIETYHKIIQEVNGKSGILG